MSDKAHFGLYGFVNKQKSYISSRENLKEIYEKPLPSPRVTVGYGIASPIGPYFFETATVTGESYRNIIQQYLLPIIVL